MYTKILLSTLLFGLSTIALADVTITADDDIKITAINGQVVNQSLLQTTKQSFTVKSGQTVITARYDRLFNLSRNDHDVVKSAPITLTATLADNGQYRLTMPNLPSDYQSIKTYIKAPTLALMQGDTVITKQQGLAKSSGLSLGGLFGKANEQHEQAIANLPVATPANTLDEFMKLWLNANESEREKIRQWVNK